VQYAYGDKPNPKPIQRLWLQSMTPQAIRDGFDKLRSDAQMLGLADAARSRSEADWLVGINGTRAMTAFNSRDGGFFLTTVGRVQTPTLSIVVEREEKIRKHVRATTGRCAPTSTPGRQYEGKWFDPKWKKNPDDAEPRRPAVERGRRRRPSAQACAGSRHVTEEAKPSTQSSPLLYDLTTLQREANGRFGFSAKTTLSHRAGAVREAQGADLPADRQRALPEDYLAVVKNTFEMLADEDLPGPLRDLAAHARKGLKEGYVKPTKRVFDNTKVSDHFAIIPTLQAPASLTEIEAKLYDLVVKRFLAVFYPPAEYMVTTRISKVKLPAATHHFQTNGKVLVNPAGWRCTARKRRTRTPTWCRCSRASRCAPKAWT
jgi:DNA topoisomerase-3